MTTSREKNGLEKQDPAPKPKKSKKRARFSTKATGRIKKRSQ